MRKLAIVTGARSGTERSSAGVLVQARQLLRQESGLTRDQFEELDLLLNELSAAELQLIVRDPLHRVQLRRYQAFLWSRAVPIVIALAVCFVVSAAAGIWLTL
jgi:hypothetical protein